MSAKRLLVLLLVVACWAGGYRGARPGRGRVGHPNHRCRLPAATPASRAARLRCRARAAGLQASLWKARPCSHSPASAWKRACWAARTIASGARPVFADRPRPRLGSDGRRGRARGARHQRPRVGTAIAGRARHRSRPMKSRAAAPTSHDAPPMTRSPPPCIGKAR